MATRNYEGRKFENASNKKMLDALTIEEPLQININGKPFTISMRTPGDDISLVRGLLHSEGVIKDRYFHPDILLKKENKKGIISIVDVSIPKEKLGEGYANSRSLLSVSSCGICGKTELNELGFMGTTLDEAEALHMDLIPQLFAAMKQQQHDFNQSGGTHAAAAFTLEGKMLCLMEDIGRHNAVDKVVGKLIALEQLPAAKIVTVSGRISYEIVIKCFKARIPFLAAVSAPSSLAVDFAKELGITLLAFCRGERATCYAHPQRIQNKETNSKVG
ncbi:MAG: formate dehydrogenase accessory sulfurtransferase FdhD [Flavobacteriaceae bacterium]